MVSAARFWPHTAGGWAPMVGLVILLVGTIIALVQLAQAQRGRQAALMADMSRRWGEPELAAAREYVTKWNAAELEDWFVFFWRWGDEPWASRELDAMMGLPGFFEDVAILVQEHGISKRMAKKSFGWTVVKMWEAWQGPTLYLRAVEGRDPVYENFEWLALVMRIELGHYPAPRG